LKNHGNFFVSIPDWVSAKGMRILGAPLRGDKQIISGESGAVSAGLLSAIIQDENYDDLRKDLGLNENSEVLIFSTEGDTDPNQYEKIVWDGEF
ncbi:MAG: diaminopropionate ammonia-lyase, partial [Elusimicrobiota bacterium]|nr:diaminopropionate ammonia-lyase [Elusimicrobiota bacterium]